MSTNDSSTTLPAGGSSNPAASATIHPGLSNEQFLSILVVAASEVLGDAVTVVRFRPMDSMDWTWSIQGRVALHSSHSP